MAGFLDDYEVDLEDFEDSGFDVPDGLYSFEVIKGELRVGTQKDEDARHIVVSFSLESEEGATYNYSWWLAVPADPHRPTRRESISMSDWKKWLLGAGFDASEINGVGPDDIEGLTGTVRLVTGKPNKSGVAYQNPRDWAFDSAEEEEPKKAPARTAKVKAAPEADEEVEEEAPAPRSRRKANPFAK